MTSSQITASSSLAAIAAAADAAACAALHALNVPGRERHSERAQKTRPKFRHAIRDQTDCHRKTPGHHIHARHRISRARHGNRKEGGTAPPGPRTVEPRARPAATRGPQPRPHAGTATTKTDSKADTEHKTGNDSAGYKHLKSVVLAQRLTDAKANES